MPENQAGLQQSLELGCYPRDQYRGNGILTIISPSPSDNLPSQGTPQPVPTSPQPSGAAVAKEKLHAYASPVHGN